MKTQVGKAEWIKEAAKLIQSGELVAFPTETVYGLGANALSESAVQKIFLAKGRPQDNPLIVHIADIHMLHSVAQDIPMEAMELFRIFSPGPLTLILKKSPDLAKSVSPLLDTVGVRIPKHELAIELIQRAGVPIAAPSANISSRVSATSASHVWEDFDGKIPLILDGGDCEVGIESTIVDMTKDIPVILRPGRIKACDLLTVLPKVQMKSGEIKLAEAPGMKYSHYAPLVRCVMAKSLESALAEYDRISAQEKPVIVGNNQFTAQCKNRQILSLGSSLDEAEKNYFQTLRKAEKSYSTIILQRFEGEESAAIMNRITKSCGGKTV